MHYFAGGNLLDAGKTFPRLVDLVIAEPEGFFTFHFKISLVLESTCSSTIPPQATQTKRTMKRISILLPAIAALALGASVRADLNLPDVSQLAIIKQRIGLTDIKVTYHRPLVNGRKIWGGLVPLGEVWRAGANENTTIEFSTPVSIEGKPLPAGTYGVHMIPNADTWTVIFSKMAVAWGSCTYDQR